MAHRRSRGFTLIELMIVVAIIGILAVLGVFGVRRYLLTSKTAEATLNLGSIERAATEAQLREKMSGAYAAPGKTTSTGAGFCASEPALVPSAAPKGKKYTSGASDWAVGKGTGAGGVDVGFYCLRFSMSMPQYYAYGYTATGTGTTAGDKIQITATGDLDGNGVTSNFLMEGRIVKSGTTNALVWAPKPLATNPEE